jgi:hypothetical protein
VPSPLYLDEDSCALRLIAALRGGGIDVISADEMGNRRVSDTAQLEFAANLNRPIVTANYKDFAPLHAAWGRSGREHAGVIIWKQERYSSEQLASALMNLCSTRSLVEFRNSLVWL